MTCLYKVKCVSSLMDDLHRKTKSATPFTGTTGVKMKERLKNVKNRIIYGIEYAAG